MSSKACQGGAISQEMEEVGSRWEDVVGQTLKMEWITLSSEPEMS